MQSKTQRLRAKVALEIDGKRDPSREIEIPVLRHHYQIRQEGELGSDFHIRVTDLVRVLSHFRIGFKAERMTASDSLVAYSIEVGAISFVASSDRLDHLDSLTGLEDDEFWGDLIFLGSEPTDPRADDEYLSLGFSMQDGPGQVLMFRVLSPLDVASFEKGESNFFSPGLLRCYKTEGRIDTTIPPEEDTLGLRGPEEEMRWIHVKHEILRIIGENRATQDASLSLIVPLEKERRKGLLRHVVEMLADLESGALELNNPEKVHAVYDNRTAMFRDKHHDAPREDPEGS